MKCPKCNHKVRLMVNLFLDIPGELAYNLTKENLRKSSVKVMGAGWPTMTLLCTSQKCRHIERFQA